MLGSRLAMFLLHRDTRSDVPSVAADAAQVIGTGKQPSTPLFSSPDAVNDLRLCQGILRRPCAVLRRLCSCLNFTLACLGNVGET